MRKRYLLVMIVLVMLFLSIATIYYLSLPETFPNVFNEPQNIGNETENRGFLGLPIKLPWQTTTSNKSSGGGGTGGGTGGGDTGGGTGGGTGETEKPSYSSPRNYLSVNSIPDGLKIFVIYSIDGNDDSIALNTPFNLGVDPDSLACFLPASITTKGTLRWIVDGQNCQPSVCETFSFERKESLYSDYGCVVDMNIDHIVTLSFTPS